MDSYRKEAVFLGIGDNVYFIRIKNCQIVGPHYYGVIKAFLENSLVVVDCKTGPGEKLVRRIIHADSYHIETLRKNDISFNNHKETAYINVGIITGETVKNGIDKNGNMYPIKRVIGYTQIHNPYFTAQYC